MRKLLLVLLLFYSAAAPAATARKVFFSQQGSNTTVVGIKTPVSSACVINVTNPSSASQDITVTLAANSTGPATNSPAVSCVASSGSCSLPTTPYTGALAGGNTTITFTITYAAYPTIAMGTTVGTQLLNCTGSVAAIDTSGTAGFVIANGTINTFIEGGQVSSSLASRNIFTVVGGVQSKTQLNGAQAVFNRVPISINQGKPF